MLRSRSDAGSVSLELVLLVPVLVLLTLFVLWAGRGGQVALSADLAAEEAAAAAAFCCEEGSAGAEDREEIAHDMLRTNPYLGLLCIGGPQPAAQPDNTGDPMQFVREEWVEFGQLRDTGGVGVLGVQLACETDGAVAPLRGIFPSVAFYGQASEVVLRESLRLLGFERTRFAARENSGPLEFTIRSVPAYPRDITVTYVVELSATTAEPADFDGVTDFAALASNTNLMGTLFIPANRDRAVISVPLIDDDVYEGTEDVVLRITDVEERPNLGDPTTWIDRSHLLNPGRVVAAGTIEDDEPQPHLVVACGSPSTVTEGGVGGSGGVLGFTVRLRDRHNREDAPAADPIEVVVEAVGGSTGTAATPTDDFDAVPTSGSRFVFAPGEFEMNVSVTTTEDSSNPVPEDDETVTLRLDAPGGTPWPSYISRHPSSCDGTIIDDEAVLVVVGAKAVAGGDDENANAVEGNNLEFELQLRERYGVLPDTDVDVDYTLQLARTGEPATFGGPCSAPDATDGPDYTGWEDPPNPGTFASSGSVTFSQPSQIGGTTTQTVTVTTCEDPLVEPGEQFWLAVSIPPGNEAATPASDYGGYGQILDDDIAVVTVGDARASETDGRMSFTVRLEVNGQPAQLAGDLTVDATTISGTATGGADCATTGVDYVTLAPRELRFSPEVPDDPLTTVNEHMAAVTSHDISIVICDDGAAGESEETFQLELSNPSRADLFDGNPNQPDPDTLAATGTITSVDPPRIVAHDIAVFEGDPLAFEVTLCDPRPGVAVSFDYRTASREAKRLRDYAADVSGSRNFDSATALTGNDLIAACGLGARSGSRVTTDAVTTLPDRLTENAERLELVLSNQVPATLQISNGFGTILDVPPAVVRVSTPVAREGEDLTFVISLMQLVDADRDGTPELEQPFPMGDLKAGVTVMFRTDDGTAAAGADYTAHADAVTFVPNGVNTFDVAVITSRDALDEPDETVHLVLSIDLSNPIASLGDRIGTGTIEDLPPPRICIEDAPPVREGEPAQFTVTLRDADDPRLYGRCRGALTTTDRQVTVDYSTVDRTAAQPADYVAESGTVTFAPTQNTQTIDIATELDDTWEPAETFRVDLDAPANATIDRAVGIGTIRANCVDVDDASEPPTITVHSHDRQENALRAPVFVSFSRPVCDDFSLMRRYVWDPGEGATATPADGIPNTADVTTAPASATFSAADSELDRLEVHWHPGIDDDLDEDDEVYFAEVAWGDGVHGSGREMPARFRAAGWSRATMTIIDDDDEPNLRIADADAQAGDAMTFTVTLDAPSGRAVTFGYHTVDGTAAAGDDYDGVPAAALTTRTMAAGLQSQTFTISTHANSLGETDETFRVQLVDAVNAKIDDGVGVGTILAGPAPTLRIADAGADEGETMRFEVTLSAAATQPISVDYTTQQRTQGPGAATEGSDYTAASDTLQFAIGDDQKFIDVAIIDDGADEANETFLVELSNATTGVSLADPSGVGTINGNVDCVDRRDIPGADPMPTPSVTGASAAEGDGQMTLTISIDPPLCQDYTFRFLAFTEAAVLGEDFLAPSPVNLGALDADVDVPITILDDDIDEDDESFRLRVYSGSSPGRRNLPDVFVNPVIVDDDIAAIQLPDTTTTAEGGYLSFVVRLDNPTTDRVEFDYEIADGASPAAIAGDDYEPRRGRAAIPAGEFSVTIPVRTIDDELFEFDENVAFTISNLTGADADPDGDTVAGTITDNDDPPAVSISDAAADEGSSLEFVVQLEAPSGRPASVSYTTRDGAGDDGATAPGDYTARSSTITFAPGDSRRTVSIASLADEVVESDERFYVDLVAGTADGMRIDDGTGAGIISDLSARDVRVADAFAAEGAELRFDVSFQGTPRSQDITIDYRTDQDTATAGTDYGDAFETSAGQVRILAGHTSATVRIATTDDLLDEDAERLWLRLSNPHGAVLADSDAAGVILDDDPPPSLSVNDVEVTEGDGAAAVFTLALSEASGRNVSVTYNTSDATATAGGDYQGIAAAGQQAVIPAGDISVDVRVPLVNDETAEQIETFQLVLSDPANATLADSIGIARILDDDNAPQILVDDPAQVLEGDSATVEFVVRLSRPTSAAVTVDYATEAAGATAGSDFVAQSGTLTFAANDSDESVVVALVNDTIVERTETFRLRLTNESSNATIGDDVAVATIVDDDGLPAMSIADAIGDESASAMFTVSLARQSAQPVSVSYQAVADPTGAGTAAIAGQDFTAVSGTLQIPARSSEAAISVPLPDDLLDEHTETFWVRLSGPNGARLEDGTAVGAILDDDPLPQVAIDDVGAVEGETLGFAVRLDAASGRTVSVPWTTASPGEGSDHAVPGDDFTAASGTVTFAAGSDTEYIEIVTLDDETAESDETLLVQLGQPTFAALGDNLAVGTISDDDGLPRISIADTELLESDSPAVFAVTLSRASSQPVTVTYTTSNGTAEAGADYATTSAGETGTLTISAGLTNGEISVYVVDDNIAEDTETFHIRLSDPQNAVIAGGADMATAHILDDERTRVSIEGSEASEGDATIQFEVTLSHTSTDEVTVQYTTFDGTANQPDDYVADTGIVTIRAGDSTATIDVALADDGFVEPTESFLLRLSSPTNADIAESDAIGVIFDDDDLPRITVGDITGREDDGTLTWEVQLSHSSDQTITVDYATSNGHQTCQDQPPFTHVSGTLTLEPGDTAATIDLPLVDNNTVCWPGSTITAWIVVLTLSHPVNATLDDRHANAVIVDEESPVLIGFADFSTAKRVGEGDGTLNLAVEMQRTADTDITINYRIDSTQALYHLLDPFSRTVFSAYPQATAGSDFTAAQGSLTFTAGERLAYIPVAVLDDSDSEEPETFAAVLAPYPSGTAYISGAYRARIEISDDDGVNLSVEDIDAAEDSGTALFRVALDRTNSQTITVDYSTADGSATSPDDYAETRGTLTFAPGATSAFVSVPLVDDDIDDPDETFELTLRNANGAVIGDGTATATIRDDDGAALPTITVADSERTEDGHAGSECLPFELRLSEPNDSEAVSVEYQFIAAPWLGDHAATPGDDYVDYGAPRRTWILAGDTTTQLCALITQDDVPEHDEKFILWLSNPENAVLGNNRAWGTILNNDQSIVSVENVTVSESAGFAEFTLSLHEPSPQAASVRYATAVVADPTGAAAFPDEDYTHTSGTALFPVGTTTATVRVPILSDDVDELDERFALQLSHPVHVSFEDSVAYAEIVDDDPGWWVDDVNVREDDGTADFTVHRDHTGTEAFTLRYEVAAAGGSATGGDAADGCVADIDFLIPSGSIEVAADQTEVTISVTICDDSVAESRETLLLELTNVDGRDLAGIATIIDNEG